MAVIASCSLQFASPFPCSIAPTQKQQSKPLLSFSTRALEPENQTNASDTTETPPPAAADTESFENRLAQVRLRYRSGTGKKAEVRKGKRSKKGSGGAGGSVFLPPVPLKESVSGGMQVEFGFTPYAERLNGKLAALGLAALLLVELGSGKSLISYHTPAIIFIQIYFVAAVSALFVKIEKERISVWPVSK